VKIRELLHIRIEYRSDRWAYKLHTDGAD